MHFHLASGLRELGHAVSLASSGDGWKRMPADIHLGFDDPPILRKIERTLKPFVLMGSLQGFDIVQLQNPVVFPWRLGVNAWAVRRIARSSRRVFLAAAGDDAFFWRVARGRLRYGPFEDFLKYDLKAARYFWQSERMYRWNLEVVDMASRVIPVCYEYWLAYRDSPKVTSVVPLPIDCRAIPYGDNHVSGKLRIAHGLIREGFKGTRLIRKVLDEMQQKYPGDVEIIYLERLSYRDFIEALGRVNVLVDQALSHSWGMSAVLALAMGRVVLSGAEPEALQALGVADAPVINLPPEESGIRHAIEKLIAMKGSIPDLGRRSRRFAEQVHDAKKVAQQYLKIWTEA
jgi:glycosyltransferase involved in cell wall biosynthesis